MLLWWDGIGQLMTGVWFPPDMMPCNWGQTVQSWFHQTRYSCFSQSQCPVRCFFCKPKVGFHKSFTKEKPLSGLSAVKPRSVGCCSDGCPSGSFSTEDLWSLAKVTIGFMVTSLIKALLCWLINSARWPAVGVLVVPNVFHMEAAVLLGTFWRSRNFFVAFPRSVPQQYPVSELCWQFLWPHGSIVALIGIFSCETLYRQVCAFPNHVQSTEFTTVGLKDTSKMIKSNRRHLS